MLLRTMMTALAAIALPTGGHARSDVELTRHVYVERHLGNGDMRELASVSRFRPGDTVVLVVRWKSGTQPRGFAVSSAIPSTLSYQGSSRTGQIVSVDNGRSWGTLSRLTISDGTAMRSAVAQDVTHLRWTISSAQARAGSGQLTYSAIVKRLPR